MCCVAKPQLNLLHIHFRSERNILLRAHSLMVPIFLICRIIAIIVYRFFSKDDLLKLTTIIDILQGAA